MSAGFPLAWQVGPSIFRKGGKTMKPRFKILMLLTAVFGLSGPLAAMADIKDYNYKAWNQDYNRNRQSSRTTIRSRSYRVTAPVIVRSEQASQSVAQAPSERRSYSYQPTPCPPVGASDNTAPAQVNESARSNSYDPSTAEPVVRSYSAPRTRSSSIPLYLLQKTDPRKFGGGR